MGEQIKNSKYTTSRMDDVTLSFTPKGDSKLHAKRWLKDNKMDKVLLLAILLKYNVMKMQQGCKWQNWVSIDLKNTAKNI